VSCHVVSGQKRKRAESSGEERDEGADSSENGESSEEGPEEGTGEDEAEYPDPRPRPRKRATSTKKTVATSASNGSTRKKPRVIETTRRRKHSTLDTVAAMKDASISDDNALFSKLTRSSTISVRQYRTYPPSTQTLF
jgi:hypothetical protein